MPLTSRIFLGLAAGIALGAFLGAGAQPLKIVGDIYVGLMQMTVLPFIVFTLIGNIGQLKPDQLQVLGKTGLVTYLIIWLVAAGTTLAFAQSFPDLETGRFFSSSLIEPPPPINEPAGAVTSQEVGRKKPSQGQRARCPAHAFRHICHFSPLGRHHTPS